MSDLKKLSEIFEKRIFVIPDYQRGYAWSEDQWRDLVEDLEDLARIHQLGRASYMHFTGTIVAKRGKLAQRSEIRVDAVTYKVYDLVDGQQRVTTLVVLLNEIARVLNHLGQEQSSKNLIANFVEIQPGIWWRLNLNGALDGFFKSNVLRNGHDSATQLAENNLLSAKRFFRAYVQQKIDAAGVGKEQQSATLDELCSLITESLGFVWHEVEGDHEVSIIFETMNSRGRPLTQFEKVKNILFFLAERNATEDELASIAGQINSTWSAVLTTLHSGAPRTDEDDFLRYFWAVFPHALYYQDNQRDRTFDIHRAVKQSQKMQQFKAAPLEWITGFLNGMRDYAPLYRDIQKPEYDDSFANSGQLRNELARVSLSMARIGREANLVPLLMAAYHELRTAPQDLFDVFGLIEVFSFRLLLQGRYASTGRSRAFDLAATIAAGKLTAKQIKDQINRELIDYYCNDQVFKQRLSDKTINFYEWGGIRYFLFEYERTLAKNNALPIDWDQFMKLEKRQTIEHVLPQGERTLDEPYWSERFTSETWQESVNRLGNLSLTEFDWNASLSNKGFDKKRGLPNAAPGDKVYRNSKFQSERELADWDDWTTESVNERESKLIQFATVRWGRTPSAGS